MRLRQAKKILRNATHGQMGSYGMRQFRVAVRRVMKQINCRAIGIYRVEVNGLGAGEVPTTTIWWVP